MTFPLRAVLRLCAGAWHLHTDLLCYGKPGMRELIAGDKQGKGGPRRRRVSWGQGTLSLLWSGIKGGGGGHSSACMASPGADLLEHGETVQQQNESLRVKYNSHAIVEYKFWGGTGTGGGNHAVAAMETKSSPSQGGDVPKSWAAWLLLTSQARPPPPHLCALS